MTRGWAQRMALLALVAVAAAVASSYLIWGPSPSTADALAPAAKPGLSGTVEGRACLKDGFCYQAPVPHVFVVVTAPGLYRQAETGAAGEFRLALEPGDYFLSVSDGRGHHLGKTLAMTMPASGRLRLVVAAG